MAKFKAPSWLAIAPKHPGDAGWGKFTADQWRTFCTVNLPITLIRLWGHLPENSQQHQALINFMHLVTVVEFASMRKMTRYRIEEYETNMLKYLTGLLELYPGTTLTPYQHHALHFPSMLRNFGPTHGYRCWPFERINNKLRSIPTNNKFGNCFSLPRRVCLQ